MGFDFFFFFHQGSCFLVRQDHSESIHLTRTIRCKIRKQLNYSCISVLNGHYPFETWISFLSITLQLVTVSMAFKDIFFFFLEAIRLILLKTMPASTGTDLHILFESCQFNWLHFRWSLKSKHSDHLLQLFIIAGNKTHCTARVTGMQEVSWVYGIVWELAFHFLIFIQCPAILR